MNPDEFVGPYSTEMGQDAYLHPTNSYGRCEQMNTTGVCPTAAQRTTYLMGQPLNNVVSRAQALGITIPVVPTVAGLVPLIIAKEFV